MKDFLFDFFDFWTSRQDGIGFLAFLDWTFACDSTNSADAVIAIECFAACDHAWRPEEVVAENTAELLGDGLHKLQLYNDFINHDFLFLLNLRLDEKLAYLH